MKRSDFFIRLTTGVLFLAVACYIGVYLYNAAINTYEITLAVSFTVEETLPTQGYIIRTEQVLNDRGIAVLPIVSEGEKLASGQAVAVEYPNPEALAVASEVRVLRLKIAQYESFENSGDTAGYQSMLNLSAAVHGGDLSGLDELTLSIETNIFTGTSALDNDITALYERLAELERRNTGTRTIYAPVSGTFSHTIDGYEHIGPESLRDITPSKFYDLLNTAAEPSGIGKLVTEFKWYYAAVIDHEDAARLTAGRRITVQFAGTYYSEESMLIEYIGKREDGKCVVYFTSDSGIHDITQLRSVRADVVFNVISGIRVPKEAIHLDNDGTMFIYLQTGVRAERVNIEILRELGDVYLVRDGTETGTPLRPDATIIVKANNLYHGKVVA